MPRSHAEKVREVLLADLRECGEHPVTYGQETHGELHLDALTEIKRLMADLERTQRDLREAWLADIYVNDGPAIWIADAEKKGQSLDEQLARLAQLLDGTFI